MNKNDGLAPDLGAWIGIMLGAAFMIGLGMAVVTFSPQMNREVKGTTLRAWCSPGMEFTYFDHNGDGLVDEVRKFGGRPFRAIISDSTNELKTKLNKADDALHAHRIKHANGMCDCPVSIQTFEDDGMTFYPSPEGSEDAEGPIPPTTYLMRDQKLAEDLQNEYHAGLHNTIWANAYF